jgi:hypothetical protein
MASSVDKAAQKMKMLPKVYKQTTLSAVLFEGVNNLTLH